MKNANGVIKKLTSAERSYYTSSSALLLLHLVNEKRGNK